MAAVERLALATHVLGAAGLPVAAICAIVDAGEAKLVAFEAVPGDVAALRLDDRGGDDAAGLMGVALAALGMLDGRQLPVDPGWIGPGSIRDSVAPWLDAVDADGGLHEAADSAVRVVAAEPWTAAVSHGDFVPVNILLAGDAVSALLDLDDVAIRHPLVDPAWWCVVVRHHHPDIARDRTAAFLAPTGLSTAHAQARLAAIGLLRSLQLAAIAPAEHRASALALVATAAASLDAEK